MKQKIQILPSGIPLIDNAWGGLYLGGTYLLLGAHKSGRTTLALQFVRECIEQKEVCIFFTTRRPKDLILQAASINLDLQYFISQNNVIVIRVDSSISLSDPREPDSVLAEYIKDIVGILKQYQPAKIVFDELTPFIGFHNLHLLEETFAKTFETIEDFGVTSLVVLGDPITAPAKKIVNILADHSTGIFYLQKSYNNIGKVCSGTMAITPNVGHSEGKFNSGYQIIPGKGFVFQSKDSSLFKSYSNGQLTQAELKYKSLMEIETPKNEYLSTNMYGYEDFKLLINNQIAFYKSTKQIFTLVAFKVDEAAEKNGIISTNQLKNAVRLSVEKKDKMCTISSKVLVLLIKEDQKDVSNLIARVKSNLYAEENIALSKVLSAVSVYSLRVDDSVNTSEDLLKELRSDELKGQNQYSFL